MPHQAPAAGPQRQAKRDFLAAPGGARQQQIRHVGAGDQQNQRGNDHEHGSGAGDDRPDLGTDGSLGNGRELDAPPLVVHGVLPLQILRDALDAGFGLLKAHPGFQPPNHREQQEPPLVDPGCVRIDLLVHHQGHPDVRRGQLIEPLKVRRRHAHNVVGAAVEANGSGRHPRIPAKLPGPKPVSDHGHGVCAWAGVLLGQEPAAHHGDHAEGCEVVTGDDLSRDRLRFAEAGKVQGDGGVEEQGREDLVVVAIVPVVGVGRGPQTGVARVERADGDQPFGGLDGQRAQQDGIEQREDSGIGPDAQPEGEHGGRSEGAGFQQRPNAVPQIFKGPNHAACTVYNTALQPWIMQFPV